MSSCRELRLATWVLARCTSNYRRDSLIGDLLEQYAARGGWWYCRQVLGAVRAHPFRLLWAPAESYVPSVEFVGDLIMWIVSGAFSFFWLITYEAMILGWTRLTHSEWSLIAGAIVIGAALIAAAAAVHGIQIKKRSHLNPFGRVPGFGADFPKIPACT